MSDDVKNIKFSVLNDIRYGKMCRLAWIGFDKKLPKTVDLERIPLTELRCEAIDFKRPDGIFKAKDVLVAKIKKKYKHPVSIRPKVGKDEFLIDVD